MRSAALVRSASLSRLGWLSSKYRGDRQAPWGGRQGQEVNKEEVMGREETKEDGGEEDKREEVKEMGRQRKERDTKGNATTAEN